MHLPISPLQVKAVCLALQDSNVLVQRNMLEILLYFFPFTSFQVNPFFFFHIFSPNYI